jgi:xanthine dehydrogenase YagR molybdenum-binding subunit
VTPFGGIAQADIGGVQFAAVAIDTETGVIQVERVVAVHDCGRPINPLLIESQIHGGILMGLSYALFEERIVDHGTGHVMNADLDHYSIARVGASPAIDVVLIENYLGRSATDACGVAEPATIPTAAAIANAVYNAIGVRIRELPMTPARVLAALGKVVPEK